MHLTIKKIGTFLLALSIYSTTLPNNAQQQQQEQRFWKSFGLSALIAIPTGAIMGYATGKTNKTIGSLVENPLISLSLQILVSLVLLTQQDTLLSRCNTVIKRNPQVPYDHDMTVTLGYLTYLASFLVTTKNCLILPL